MFNFLSFKAGRSVCLVPSWYQI